MAGGLNLYGYAGNDPANYSDPLGLCPADANLWQTIGCALIESGTAVLGSAAGFVAGGGAGVSGGPAAPVTVPAEAAVGAAVGGVAGKLAGELVTHALFAKSDVKQVNDAAREVGMSDEDRRDFGQFLEDEKKAGRGGTKNDRGDYTWKELIKKAKEFMDQ